MTCESRISSTKVFFNVHLSPSAQSHPRHRLEQKKHSRNCSKMKYKETLLLLYEMIGTKFQEQFGFRFKETSFQNVVNYLHSPKDPSSLAITRILFGLTMLFDIPDERGGAVINKRWGDPKICHFPLINFVQPAPMPYMALVYVSLWIGALGIMLGYKYRISASLFTVCYWYLFLIEKSFWNNHSYLFGLVSFLLTWTQANCYWSVDAYLDSNQFSDKVPYWNYFILKFQFFILYFMAGVKKGTAEWLTGYSVPNLSAHWVFTPFTLFLTVEQTDYIIVHWFIFLFDLTVAFWMMWSKTRHIAMVFCALFHLMNIRLFTIGMFPWVCLATMPLFYPFDWPKILCDFVKVYYMCIKRKIFKEMNENNLQNEEITEHTESENDYEGVFENSKSNDENEHDESNDKNTNEHSQISSDIMKTKDILYQDDTVEKNIELPNSNTGMKPHHAEIKCKEKVTTILIIVYVVIQSFLPFSHFITKGYNNWTNGLYGYSWDMMVHTWDIQSVVVKVVDNDNQKQFFIDPDVFTPNDRWFKHGDMVHQYTRCVRSKLLKEAQQKQPGLLSNNISIYVDVWCSMNGRFVQRMFDNRIDLLQVSWNPFQKISFLMPLLDEASEWRSKLNQIRAHVQSWDQHSDVIFFADFPGYDMEKYIPEELSNVTLTVLHGQVVFEPEVTKRQNGQSYQIKTNHRVKVNSGMFHRVFNIGNDSAFFMYTFHNTTDTKIKQEASSVPRPKLPIMSELQSRFRNMIIFADAALNGIYQSFFRLPMCLA